MTDVTDELGAVFRDLGMTQEHIDRGLETVGALMAMSTPQSEMALEVLMRASPDGDGREMVRRMVFGYVRAYCRAYDVTPEELFRQVFSE